MPPHHGTKHAAPAGTAAAVLIVIICSAASAFAAVPADLTNFQNEYPCDQGATLIVRPQTLNDVVAAVSLHDKIMTNGEGHSWNQPFFCVTPGAPLNATLTGSSKPAEQFFKLVTSADGAMTTVEAAVAAAATNTSSNITSLAKPSAANIVMTTLRPMSITVNETDETVWVDAGVKTIDLLDYLRNYVTAKAPSGYTLGSFPWFVYQSIGGAVATGSHGSSLEHNSLSHQVVALDVVLANGTRRTFTNQTEPFLMKALRVSVGKLGIIVRLKLKIYHEVPVRRTLTALNPEQFLTLMQSAQEDVEKGGSPPAWVQETEAFWVVQKHQFLLVQYNRADSSNPTKAKSALKGFKPDNTTIFTKKGDVLALGELVIPADADVKIGNDQVIVSADPSASRADNAPYARAQNWLDGFITKEVNAPVSAAVAGQPVSQRTLGARWIRPKKKPASGFHGAANMADGLMEISRLGVQTVAGNVSAESTSVYIKQPKGTLKQLQSVLYDQYEVSIPLSAVGSCWAKLLDVVYQGDLLGTNTTRRLSDKGFRTAPLMRFVGQEDGLLSHTYDGPRMYLNIEDYLYYNTGNKQNQKFRAVMKTLRGDPACAAKGQPRLHWGKAGWPDPGCWHGDKEYGNNWCHFGCAVQQLDPQGKFADSAPDRWTWAGVDLKKCCGPQGFMVGTAGCECKVTHARNLQDCPPAPFYTYR